LGWYECKEASDETTRAYDGYFDENKKTRREQFLALGRPISPERATSRSESPWRMRTRTCRCRNISNLLRLAAISFEQKARSVAVPLQAEMPVTPSNWLNYGENCLAPIRRKPVALLRRKMTRHARLATDDSKSGCGRGRCEWSWRCWPRIRSAKSRQTRPVGVLHRRDLRSPEKEGSGVGKTKRGKGTRMKELSEE